MFQFENAYFLKKYAILFAPFILIPFLACAKKDERVYVVPNNYQGNVYIIFDKNASPTYQKEAERTIYKIPEDGVLYTPPPIRKNNTLSYFYYEESDSSQRELLQANKNTTDTTTTYLFRPSSGLYGSSDSPCHFRYLSFIVGKVGSEKNYFPLEDHLNKKIENCQKSQLNQQANQEENEFKESNKEDHSAFHKLKDKLEK